LWAAFALDHFEHQVVKLVVPQRLVSDVVKRADVLVVERGHRLRFALEARAQLLVAREVRRQELDRHRPVEPLSRAL
jgi:hypothetical protein